MKSLKQIQEEELKKFDKEFPIIQLHDPNIPFFAKDLKLEVRKFLLSAMESAARGERESIQEIVKGMKMAWPEPVPLSICIADGYNQAITDVANMITDLKAKDYLGDTHD